MMIKSLRFLLFLLIGFGSFLNVYAEDFTSSKVEETNTLFTPFFNDTIVAQDTFFISDCAGELCIDIPFPESQDSFNLTVNGVPYAGNYGRCNLDTIRSYRYDAILGEGQLGPHFLNSWQVDNNTFSGQFNLIPDLVDSMNVWDPSGNWQLDESSKVIFGGQPNSTYTNMEVTVITVNLTYTVVFDEREVANGTELTFSTGMNEAILVHKNNACRDTFYVGVACTTPLTDFRTINVDDIGTYCIDNSELLGSNITVINDCSSAGGQSASFTFGVGNTCVDYRGLQNGIDSLCFVACDEFGVCDTTTLVVTVTGGTGGSIDYIEEVLLGQTETRCLRRDFFTGTPDTIYNICDTASGAFASFIIDSVNYCINYTGNTVGGLDSACYVVCDEFDVCDTTYLIVNVVMPPSGGSRNITDEILVGTSGEICIDTSVLAGTINQFFDGCAGDSGTFIDFDLDINRYCISYTALAMGGPEQACITICDDLGACDTTNIIVTAFMPLGGTNEIYDTIYINGMGQTCIDTTGFAGLVDTLYNACETSSGNFTNVSVDLNTYCVNYTATNQGSPDTACIYLVNTLGEIDTTFIYLTVNAPSPETKEETVLIGQTETICLDTTELSGTIVNVENGCQGSSGTLVTFVVDPATYCVDFTGTTVGKQDTACIILVDENGVRDTTTFIVEVLPPTPEMVYDTVVALQSKTYCLDTTELVIEVDTIYSICNIDADTNVTVVLDTATYCVTYTGIQGKENGSDTLCYVLCNDRGICDTSYLYLFNRELILTASFEYDTITVNNSSTTCLSSDELPSDIQTIVNDCPSSSGEFVVFEDPNFLNCVNYDGMDLGTDTACLIMTDLLGYQDTIFLVVTVTNPMPETVFDTIMSGMANSLCIDTTELSGTIDTIYNICEDASGTSVNFEINRVSLCVDATTISPGIDSSCIVICDDLGLCDTTYYIVNVMDQVVGDIPVTVDDVDTTLLNEIVVVNALGNDQIPPDFDVFEVISGPSNGVAIADPLGTITYTPDTDFCGETDSLEYRVCNVNGCDTALVSIFVSCEEPPNGEELVFYEGFSPNGDAFNDYFIQNLQNFPEHKLYVYNRWGSLVFETELPTDRWDGKFSGRDVPDGVYFYALDDGEGNKYSGYVVVRR